MYKSRLILSENLICGLKINVGIRLGGAYKINKKYRREEAVEQEIRFLSHQPTMI